jgi:hypothetical protein
MRQSSRVFLPLNLASRVPRFYGAASACRILGTRRCSFRRDSSCCQTRSTRQPSALSLCVTRRSRPLFRASFTVQNAWLFVGLVACFGHACQKQPSTKTTRRCFGNTKSGLPNSLAFRRQPEILYRRIKDIKANSVALLPRQRTRDMIWERFKTEKTSVIKLTRCGDFFS